MDAVPKGPGELSPLDWYRLFRSRIEHEDSLIIQRLSWLVASQSFLFTAYAVTTNGLSNLAGKNEGVFVTQQLLLFRLIPLVAISNAALIYLSIIAALKAIQELRRSYGGPSFSTQLPSLQTRSATRLLGLSAPLLLPLLFAVVWLYLLVHGLSRG